VPLLNKTYDNGDILALRKKLHEVPADLHELFRSILVRNEENMEAVKLCLQWILYSKRPLTREELYFAIRSGSEPEELSPWDPDEISMDDIERYILSSSKGLAEVTKFKARSVQLIHESVRDFLLKDDGLSLVWPDLSTNIAGISHDRLKECCYNYSQLDALKRMCALSTLPKASSAEAAES